MILDGSQNHLEILGGSLLGGGGFKYVFGFSLPNPGVQMGWLGRNQPPTIVGKLGVSLLFLLLPYHPWDEDVYLPT